MIWNAKLYAGRGWSGVVRVGRRPTTSRHRASWGTAMDNSSSIPLVDNRSTACSLPRAWVPDGKPARSRSLGPGSRRQRTTDSRRCLRDGLAEANQSDSTLRMVRPLDWEAMAFVMLTPSREDPAGPKDRDDARPCASSAVGPEGHRSPAGQAARIRPPGENDIGLPGIAERRS